MAFGSLLANCPQHDSLLPRDTMHLKPPSAPLAIQQEKWDKTDEKPAVVAISLASFVAIWATAGVVDRIDELPIISNLLEVVGLFVTSWFTYRYLAFKSDRCACISFWTFAPHLERFVSLLDGWQTGHGVAASGGGCLKQASVHASNPLTLVLRLLCREELKSNIDDFIKRIGA